MGCRPKPISPDPVVQVKAVSTAPNTPTAAPVQKGFVPLVPRGGPARADAAPGPKCRVTEHKLGKLADPAGNLFPVRLAADSNGAIVVWNGPTALSMQQLDVGGKPTGVALQQPSAADEIPMVFLSSQPGLAPGSVGSKSSSAEDFAFIRMAPKEFHVAWIDRAHLRVIHERSVSRTPEMANVLEAVYYGGEVSIVGVGDKSLTFLRFGKDGATHSATVVGPKFPGDPLITMGFWDGEVAMKISTISGALWLATPEQIRSTGLDVLPPENGSFVRPLLLQFNTGATTYGLQKFAQFPLSRAEDAELLEQKPDEAFRIGCTYGFSSDGWTGRHFLFACAAGEPDALQSVVYGADCSK